MERGRALCTAHNIIHRISVKHFEIIHTHTRIPRFRLSLSHDPRSIYMLRVCSVCAFSAVYTHIYRILCVVLNVHAAMYQIAHLKYTRNQNQFLFVSECVRALFFACSRFSLFAIVLFCTFWCVFLADYGGMEYVWFSSRFTVHVYSRRRCVVILAICSILWRTIFHFRKPNISWLLRLSGFFSLSLFLFIFSFGLAFESTLKSCNKSKHLTFSACIYWSADAGISHYMAAIVVNSKYQQKYHIVLHVPANVLAGWLSEQISL